MDTVLLFLNLGGSEIFLVLIVILIFFGAKRVPELARGLGKGIREFKDATSGIQREIQESTKSIKEETDEIKKGLKDNI